MRRSARRLWLPSALLALVYAGLPSVVAKAEDLSPGGEPHRVHALVGGTVVPRPGERIEGGVVVIRDGRVEAVGADVAVPPDALRWDLRGRVVYPGLIEPYLRLDPPSPPASEAPPRPSPSARTLPPGGARHENPAVRADRRAAAELRLDAKTRAALREAGFTAALVAPARGIFRGSSVLVTLGEGPLRERVLRAEVAEHLAFESKGSGYPNSLMGAMALARQTLLDAERQRAALAAYARNPLGVPRPEHDLALAALAPVLSKERPVCFEAPDAQTALRAARLLAEFRLTPWLVLGSGDAWRWLDELAALGAPLVTTLNLPPAPRWEDPSEEPDVETDALRAWRLARREPSLLSARGLRFSFTCAGLNDRKTWRARVRELLAAGLDEDEALAALTTAPAAMLGSPPLGVIAPGVAANFTVCDGPLFAKETRLVETWIDGRRYLPPPRLPTPEDLAGRWTLRCEGADTEESSFLLAVEEGALCARLAKGTPPLRPAPALRRDRLEVVLPAGRLAPSATARVVLRLDGRRALGRWSAGGRSGAVFATFAPASPEGRDAPAPDAPAPDA
ncbi:MAG: hypothetical protein D6731_03305, partial [Planctomycetota bacterium]